MVERVLCVRRKTARGSMATKKTAVKNKTLKKAVVVAAVLTEGAEGVVAGAGAEVPAAIGATVVAAATSMAAKMARLSQLSKAARLAKAAAVADGVTGEAAAPKTRKRMYTKQRLTALLDVMLTQFADQLCGKPLSYSAGDGLKMMQMREHAEPERPTEVKVGWVEEPRP